MWAGPGGPSEAWVDLMGFRVGPGWTGRGRTLPRGSHDVIQEVRTGHPVERARLGRSHDHAHEGAAGAPVRGVDGGGREAPVGFDKLAELLVDARELVAQEDAAQPQLSLDVNEGHLACSPARRCRCHAGRQKP